MAEAFIYDHVRTPRGRGKPDGALYEVPTVRLAAGVLLALRDRSELDTRLVDDVILGCVDPVGEAGGDVARAAVFAAGYGAHVPGMQINRFCASGLDAVNMAAAQVMSGQHDLVVAGGVESHVARRHRRIRRGLAGRPVRGRAVLFHAAGRLGRPDRHEVRILARRLRRLCRGKPAAHGGGLERRPLRPLRGSRSPTSTGSPSWRATSIRAPRPNMQSLAALNPAFEIIGQMGGFDAVAIQAHPDVEKVKHVHHAGNSSGIVDGAAAVLVGNAEGGAGRRPEAARQESAPSPTSAPIRR